MTKALTTGFLSALGDFICQKIEAKPHIDWKRLMTFSSVGCFYIGPILHLNYCKLLPALVPAEATASMTSIAFKKLLIDQLCFAPVCTTGFFFVINTIEGKGISQGAQDVRDKLWRTMVVNWQIWVPANAMNFYFMPLRYQVLFSNFVSITYNVCLSAIHNNDLRFKQ